MKSFMTTILFTASFGLFAQDILINPDGTHSIAVGSGIVKTVFNPNGTISQIFDHGLHKIIVNPDGTQSIAVGSGPLMTIINPNGTQSQVVSHGTQKIITRADGSQSILVKQGNVYQLVQAKYKPSSIALVKKGRTITFYHPDGTVSQFTRQRKNRMR